MLLPLMLLAGLVGGSFCLPTDRPCLTAGRVAAPTALRALVWDLVVLAADGGAPGTALRTRFTPAVTAPPATWEGCLDPGRVCAEDVWLVDLAGAADAPAEAVLGFVACTLGLFPLPATASRFPAPGPPAIQETEPWVSVSSPAADSRARKVATKKADAE